MSSVCELPGPSGEQSAKQTSRKLEVGNPCRREGAHRGIHTRSACRVWLYKENRANWSSDSVTYGLIAENSNAKICSMLSVHLQRSVRLRRQYRV